MKNLQKKYVLFGAGQYGRRGIRYLSWENIAFFIDNDPKKIGEVIEDIPIYSLEDVKESLDRFTVVISVSEERQSEIIRQLSENEINYVILEDEYIKIIKERLLESKENLDVYKRAIQWIKNNTLNNRAMCYVSGKNREYQEVSGYFIPSLMKWGYREYALSYAKWLCEMQQDNGAWGDPERRHSLIFDTGQVLKGLLEIRDIYPEVKEHIICACDWIISNVKENGRLPLVDENVWGKGVVNAEFVHIYCLSPLIEAGKAYDKPEYKKIAYKVLGYYKNCFEKELLQFDRLTHFQAYVLEGLLDVGEIDLAKKGMEVMSQYLDDHGYVPAYRDVDWICSTGLFQMAIVWFRIGDVLRGNRAFLSACNLQNESGGWYGSYPVGEKTMEKNLYFPNEEISWAVKFFLDALYYKQIAEFKKLYSSKNALDSFYKIEKTDELYKVIQNEVEGVVNEVKERWIHVLDVGCGRGRYLVQLSKDIKNIKLYGVEIIEEPLEYIKDTKIGKMIGTLTDIPIENDLMDVTFTCEALEHAIDISNAIKEMVRVTKPGGRIVVIDKNQTAIGKMKILEWEQYFNENELKTMMEKYCDHVKVKNVYKDAKKNQGAIFSAWIGIKK